MSSAIPPDHLQVAVITRLNVYVFKERALDDRARLAKRLDLFERRTVPSLRWQTEPADRWLIFLDETTHPEDVARVQAATVGLPVALVTLPPIYEPAHYYRTVSAVLTTDRPWTVTTRLDSDDAVSTTFLAAIRRSAQETPGEFLNVGTGFKLAGRRLTAVQDESSPFLAFVEPSGPALKTVYHAQHHQAHRSAPVRQVEHSAKWLMSVHDLNMETVLSGSPVRLSSLGRDFPYSRTRLVGYAAVEALRRRTVDRAGVRALRQRRRGNGQLW